MRLVQMIQPVELSHRGPGVRFVIAERIRFLVGICGLERGLARFRVNFLHEILPLVEALERRVLVGWR